MKLKELKVLASLIGPYAEDFIQVKIDECGENDEVVASESQVIYMLNEIESTKQLFDGRPDPSISDE